jgi:hypothetical protein
MMMKKKSIQFAACAAAACLALGVSSATGQHSHDNHDHGGHGHGGQATIKTEVLPNENHAAGKTAATVIRLTGPNGKPVTLNDLQEAHTEKLHLLIVDESLTDYHHEHPAPRRSRANTASTSSRSSVALTTSGLTCSRSRAANRNTRRRR